MDNEIRITLPADVDGYVLLQCPICCGFFKLRGNDYERANEVYCPSCGMRSDNYATNEVFELARVKVVNMLEKELYETFKQLERGTRRKTVSFKAGKKPKTEPENAIKNKKEAMKIARFDCCEKTCKIKPLFIMTGCYCPFCGVKEYEP